jgi:hypothetical protein
MTSVGNAESKKLRAQRDRRCGHVGSQRALELGIKFLMMTEQSASRAACDGASRIS